MEHHIPIEEQEEIERYLQNEMDTQEREAFLARVSVNQQLKEAVEEYRLLIMGINEFALGQQLDDFHQDIPLQQGKVFRFNRWLVAASVVLVVSVATLFILNRTGSEQQLYASYYAPDPGLISGMGQSDNYLFDKAMIDYKSGQYKQAIAAWEQLRAKAPANDTLNYFIGSASLALQLPEEAQSYFSEVINVPNSVFLDDAHWYLGLSLLKTGNTAKAIEQLKQSSHQHKEELLSKLQQK